MGSNDLRPVGAFISHTPGPDCDRFEAHTHMADGSICTPTREPVAPTKAETPRLRKAAQTLLDRFDGPWSNEPSRQEIEALRAALSAPDAAVDPARVDEIMRLTSSDNPRSRQHNEDTPTRRQMWRCVPISDVAWMREAAIRADTPALDAVLVPLDWTKQELLGIRNREYDEERWLSLDDLAALRGQPSEPA